MQKLYSREHGIDVSPDQGQQQRRGQAGGHQVQECGLRVLEHVHHEDGGEQAKQVRGERGVEVDVGVSLEALVVAEEQRDEDPGDHDVAEAEHGKVGGVETVDKQILRKHHWKN